jgi:hypothetical protein
MPTGSGISAQLGLAVEVYTNAQQTLTGTPSGTFTLTFEGATTTSLATNASAANVAAALQALPNVGATGVSASGGALPAAITITFSGPLVAARPVALLIVQTGITGLTPATSVAGTGYGTPSTVTRFLEFLNESLKLTIDRVESKALRSLSRFQRTDRWAPGKRQAAGGLEFEVQSKGFQMVLGQMLGSDPVITTPAGGSLTRDHTVTVGDDANRSFTLQIGVPDATGVSTNVQPFTYKGCKFTDWEFDLQRDGILLAKGNVDAMDEDTTIGLATASYASSAEVFYWTQAQATLGGANIDVRSFKLTGKQGYNTDRFFLRALTTPGGPSLKKQPIANAYADISGEMEIEFTGLTEYLRFVNGTTAAITLLIEGSTIESITGGTGKMGLLFTLPNCRFDGDGPDVKDQDIIPITLKFQALFDGTNAPLTVRYRSTDTTA